MKKRLLIALVALLCVASVGCAKQEKPTDNTATTASSAVTTTAHEHTHASASHSTQTARRFRTPDEAMAIAADYYDIQPGSVAPETGYVMSYRVMQIATPDNPKYKIGLQWLVTVDGTPSHQSVLDMVWIDAFTGEILPSDSEM